MWITVHDSLFYLWLHKNGIQITGIESITDIFVWMCKYVHKGERFSVIKAFQLFLFVYSFIYLKYASTFFLLIKIHAHLSSVLQPGAS